MLNKRLFVLLCIVLWNLPLLVAQSAWPSQAWTSAQNVTGVIDASNGVTELSGLHWNPDLKRLYAVADDGFLYVLQLNTTTNTFTKIATFSGLGGPEGVTQVDYNTNEFYTIDESSYEIRRYTHTANFSSDVLVNKWNLLVSPSPMSDTGNTGPEGVAFVPDSYLASVGFISTVTGATYTSKKGMGGLMFIAHQKKGWVWVFDINPAVSDDFAYVGKYKTNEDESCDLEFDRSTGMLYILHNTGDNYLEVTDLSTAIVSGDRKFVIKNEYLLPVPSGNTNIEGFAITPKCDDSTHVNAFLCRDVASDESSSYLKDCLRRFSPFTADGKCVVKTALTIPTTENTVDVFPNPGVNQIKVSSGVLSNELSIIRFYTTTGQLVLSQQKQMIDPVTIDISALSKGFYFIELQQADRVFPLQKFIKN